MTAAAQRRRFGPDSRRKALYAKIAIARKQLALAEDTRLTRAQVRRLECDGVIVLVGEFRYAWAEGR